MRFNSVLVAVFVVLCSRLVFSQTSTFSSTQWEYQQVGNSLIDRENRIKALISEVLVKIDSIIADTSSNSMLSNVNNALNKLERKLTDYNTVSSYAYMNVTLSCNEVLSSISNFRYENERCVKIKFANDVNSTLLYVDIGGLNVAYVSNYFVLNDGQRHNIQSLVTSLMVLVNEYNQHSVTLVMAIYKYARLYIELLLHKETFCSCPTQLSSSMSAALATVDSNLKQIQSSVDSRELSIRTKSSDVINKVAAISSDLKKTSAFISITTILDSIATLCKGYELLTTTDEIETSVTCDDAAKKVALLQHKFDLYHQMNAEARRNSTLVLFCANILNTHSSANYYQLSEVQNTGLKAIATSLTSLVEDFTQLILTFSTSIVMLKLDLYNAKIAKYGNCNCKETSSETTVSAGKKIYLIDCTKKNIIELKNNIIEMYFYVQFFTTLLIYFVSK
jgi:hypothetical protein